MAKKKKAKHKKKVHRHQANRPRGAGTATVAATTAAPTDAASAPGPSPTPVPAPAAVVPVSSGTSAARTSYVAGDVKRIGILVVSCVAAELILWYLFTYTGLGSAAYGLIK
jgi:hypothetical protein